MVEGIVQRLSNNGVLDDTYIFYTSDNGFHIGQHRMHPGKTCGYETDINIPLIVRGPGIGVGKVLDAVTSHTDLAPTLLKIAGAELRYDFDGLPIPFTEEQKGKTEHVNVEYWGRGIAEGKHGTEGGRFTVYANNTYKALRLIGDTYNLYYSVWCTNETELYDMTVNRPTFLHQDFANSVAARSRTNAQPRSPRTTFFRVQNLGAGYQRRYSPS